MALVAACGFRRYLGTGKSLSFVGSLATVNVGSLATVNGLTLVGSLATVNGLTLCAFN
jgi:hypothetical protein